MSNQFTGREWTEAELTYVRKNYNRLGDKEIALNLTRLTGKPASKVMVQQCRQRLGLVKPRGWSPK